ncbi:MAG: tetratricopeptide repeat protein, partial [Spirochaetia bacterium]|nr:tetratricopeptide repeat protein [Spirochaetia bacterium]
DRAVQTYNLAIQIQPGRKEAYVNLATLQVDTKQYAQAESTYKKILQKWPDDASAHREIGLLYMKHLGNAEAGKKHLKRYLELKPNAKDAAEIKKLIGS